MAVSGYGDDTTLRITRSNGEIWEFTQPGK
jgi:hypothetical protein